MPLPHGIALAIEMLALGVFASFLGSVVGLGGGFIAIPALRLLFHLPPTLVAGTSLFLVTANVGSASIAFWRQGRIEKRLGFTMGLLAIPGSILGALLLKHSNVKGFDFAYAAILAFFALDLLRKGTAKNASGAGPKLPWSQTQTFYDKQSGETYTFHTSPPIVAVSGIVTGFVSSFFGIGGGILVVPLLLRVFALPAHIVGATSHFIIFLSSPFGVATHWLNGDIDWLYAIPLAIGGVVGAQFGAETARRLSTPLLVRVLAIVLLVAAGSLIAQHII
jgi:uncharacterized membrane protein YfcA